MLSITGLALVASFVSSDVALAQSTTLESTTLDGIYSRAQAQRGSRTYRNICAHCHEGGEPDADPLFGADFIDRWREAPLSFLHGFFSREMPGDEPGTLTPQVYIDTLAFLLQENGYPAGAELKEETLGDILLVGEDGPQPLPADAMVRVVGCLAGEGEALVLEQASAPTRLRRADAPSAEELAQAKTQALGEATYTLRGNLAQQSSLSAGAKVQVQGVWLPAGASVALTVLSLDDVGQGCN
jgi:hypothetical protein